MEYCHVSILTYTILNIELHGCHIVSHCKSGVSMFKYRTD